MKILNLFLILLLPTGLIAQQIAFQHIETPLPIPSKMISDFVGLVGG
jgi:hypothetical protein